MWTVFAIARRLGIDQALGPEFAGQLALWQVLARVIERLEQLAKDLAEDIRIITVMVARFQVLRCDIEHAAVPELGQC